MTQHNESQSSIQTQAIAKVPVVSLYGVPVSRMDMKETVAYLTSVIEAHTPHQVITANPIMLMEALNNPTYHNMMSKADLVVPDGAGVVWAANHVGQPVKERVAGFDLVQELMRTGEAKRWKVYLVGASTEVIEAAAARLKRDFPAIDMVGVRNGYFGSEEDAEVIAEIRAHNPDILLVGRSAATQEPWIAQHKEALGVPVIMGVGGSFDVLSGKLKRAPKFFQKLRMEWFYRLLQEPWRYKRMLLLPKFALKVMKDRDKVLK
ncbi:WecB/TagA/CpsF family glycosyltransferase [Paenibacillus sp. N1-5-1-14]|uniref:WecB/TagA/CpsF family glycosyltransferase n=1 Tax=Paenibacillus radicibacter TaxID=2972488 RepID=UPI002159AE49|nr:WecB/TagA/CpsF family glycosyltransferase [Paenibacillus radicibacter]MCR8645062.1 WecB/TagA/CpsF family glycosyltransferase [Paenibacillus radicibacter]